jgi:hypothetical protein
MMQVQSLARVDVLLGVFFYKKPERFDRLDVQQSIA